MNTINRLMILSVLLFCAILMSAPSLGTGPAAADRLQTSVQETTLALPAGDDNGRLSVVAGKETAYYGMGDQISVRELAGYADYMVCAHALYNDGLDVLDNVRYLHDHGTRVILDMNWWDVWPFPGVVNGWPDMHKENIVYGMNATESVKYRIRGCLNNIGPEYVYAITVGEEESPPSGYPGEFVAWYLDLIYDWMKEEFPGVRVFQWPSPYAWILKDSCHLKADGIVVDDYSQAMDEIEYEAQALKDAYSTQQLVFFVSASENFGWFTAHTPTYLKQAVRTVLKHSDVVGFWVTDRNGDEGWETQNWMYLQSLEICNQIHVHEFNSVYADTSWFPDGFGNDTLTESTAEWYASAWRDLPPDSSLTITLSSDSMAGGYSVSLSRTDTGQRSFWWQPVTHDYGLPDFPSSGPYGVFNLTEASRVRYFVKGIGWQDKTDLRAFISLEKYNSYFRAGNLTLPDISSLLLDGEWHQVVVDLPLGPESYHEWDGYASQLRFVTDYTSGSGSATVLFDGFEIQALDAGKILNLTTALDCAEVVNGTLTVRGQAYVEKNITAITDWYYHVLGNGSVSMCINGSWIQAPEPGTPIRSPLTGFRLYGGSFDYVTINLIPPIVSIDSPHDGDYISGSTDVEVSVQDASGISWVEFQVDGLQRYVDTTSPYSWTWDTTTYSDGAHLLNVTAQSANGTTNFDYCALIVDNSPPVVLSISPANNSAHHGVVTASINVSDSSGVGHIEFWLGGTLLKSDSSSPYDASIDTSLYDDGYYILEILAFDTVDNSVTTCLHLMFDNSAPQVSLLSINKTLYNVTVTVNATDRYGIDRVEFYLDGRLESVDFSAPYFCTLENLTDGNYIVIATAYSVSGMERNATAAFRWDILPPETVSLDLVQTYDNVTVSVDVWDIYGVDYVRFLLDDVLVLTDYSYPYSCTFAGISDGAHTVTATICSVSGISSSSMAGFVWHTSPPEVIIDSLVETLYNVTMHAIVQDVHGVERVEFWLDGIKHTVDYAAPFTCCVVGLSEGEHTVVAVAVSMSGLNSSTSATFGWVVLRPTVSIQGLVVGLHNVTLIAEVSDPYGIDRVDFAIDGVVMFSDSVAPYMYTATALAEGDHNITVTAYSVSGLSSELTTGFLWNMSAPVIDIESFAVNKTAASMSVMVTDDYGVDRVEFWLDGLLFSTLFSSPYTEELTGLSDGSHTLVAWAFSVSGLNSSVSSSFVWQTNAPCLRILSVIVTPYDLTIDSEASDDFGLSRIEFWLDGTCMWNHSHAVYSYVLTGLTDGGHSVMIAAYSTSGLHTQIDYDFDWHTQRPSAGIQSIEVSGESVMVTAYADDLFGVDFVRFYLDGVLSYTDYVVPFCYTITNPAIGTHSVLISVWSVSGYRANASAAFIWDVTRPYVSIVDMQQNATCVTVEAGASDVYGIERIELWLDGVCILNHTGAACSYVLETPEEGGHTFLVTAFSVTGRSSSIESSFEWHVAPPEIHSLSLVQGTSEVWVGIDVTDVNDIEYVEFWFDDELYDTDTTSPFECTLSELAYGQHMVDVVVHSSSGKNATSRATFSWALLEPQIELTSVLETPSGLWVAAVIEDRFGIGKVEFFIDGDLVETLYAPPFACWFVALAEGNHTVVVKAYNIFDLSSSLEITVTWDLIPPHLSLASPILSLLAGSHQLALDVYDISGVQSVEFLIDGMLAATLTGAPYTWTMDTTLWPDGNHTVLIRAIDRRGNGRTLTLSVLFDNSPPVLTLLEPVDDSSVEGPATIVFRVAAADLCPLDDVLLSYRLGLLAWTTVEMVLTLDGYYASVPANPSDRIEFRFICNDSLGNVAVSDLYSVEVVDTIAPTVSIDSWLPVAPDEGEVVLVRISTHDAAGIESVILYFRVDGTEWRSVDIHEVSGIWEGAIPGQASGSVVEFYAAATDLSSNIGASLSYSYTVSTTSSVTPDVLVIVVGAGLGGAGTVAAVVIAYSIVKKRKST